MRRIDTTNKSVNLFGAGKHGFRNGNKAVGINPTEFDADWCNHIQEELAFLVESNEVALNPVDRTQIRVAVQAMIRSIMAKYGLGTADLTDYGGDLNVLTEGGIYLAVGANSPTAAPYFVIVMSNNFNNIVQIAVMQGSSGLHIRNSAGGVWSAWTNYTVTDASTTVKGIVELATDAEAQTLSSNLLALTPSTLAAAFKGTNQSFAADGYQKLPGGLILQWGRSAVSIAPNGGVLNITFPIAFVTEVGYSTAQVVGLGVNAQALIPTAVATTLTNLAVTNNDTDSPITQIRWFSIGW